MEGEGRIIFVLFCFVCVFFFLGVGGWGDGTVCNVTPLTIAIYKAYGFVSVIPSHPNLARPPR